ncbi:MAG: sugar phosphate isomerase/epimerase [Candidatus Omnitrophica bacterium]|nr:sugar phosphate isomerase/epimerase [Candidatus Omnitrophota bacterium]
MNSIVNTSRRGFIRQSAGFALAATTMNFTGMLMASEEREPWAIACRDPHLRVTGQPDCWAAMKQLGLSGVEAEANMELACPGLYHPTKKYSLDSPAHIQALKDDLAQNKLKITAFLMYNQLDQRLEQEIEWAKRLVQAAQELEVRAIRIDVAPQRLRRDEFLPFAILACKKLCEVAEGTAVRYGIENHSNMTNDPEFLGKLFDGVGSPHLGLTLDTGNFYWYGHPLDRVYEIFEQFAPRVVHTHCKSIHFPEDKRNVRRPMGWEYGKYNCPIYDGDIDFHKVAAILRKANYAGDLCIEDESLSKFPEVQRAAVLKKEADFLRELA